MALQDDAIVQAALGNRALTMMAEDSDRDAREHGTHHWPTLEQVEQEYGMTTEAPTAGPQTTAAHGTEWVGPPHDHLLHLEFGPETWRSSARVGEVPLHCTRMSIETDTNAEHGLSVVRLEVPMRNAISGTVGPTVYEGVLVTRDEYAQFLEWRNKHLLDERRKER